MIAKFNIYDKVQVFGRSVTIIDRQIHNNEVIYTVESSIGYESISEGCLVNELNIKDMPKLDFEIGDEVIIVDTKGHHSKDRELERAIVTDVDTKGIDLVYMVTFKDGNSDFYLPARLMAVDSFEDEYYTTSSKEIESSTDGLLKQLDDVVADLIDKLDKIGDTETNLLDVFSNSPANDRIEQKYVDFDDINKSIKIEKDRNDFYKLDLNPANPLEDKIILSSKSFTNLFAAMRKM